MILHVERLSINMSKRRLPIWQFFTAGEGDRQVPCNICNATVSRGGQLVKSFTTTNLVGHLRKHPPEFKKYIHNEISEQNTDMVSTMLK